MKHSIKRRGFLLMIVSFLSSAAVGKNSKFKIYKGPEITKIDIYKSKREMYLMHKDKAIVKYKIGLGFAPLGHKRFEGDGKTPEGLYYIDRRNPNSRYHLSLGISYPNLRDRFHALINGHSAGGDIFIHGGSIKELRHNNRDWTLGCIALTNDEIEDIYAMINIGTPVVLHP